jgi:uncharacterized protein with HEPN domain
MSRRADEDFLGDIREALQRIRTYAAGMSYETLAADIKTQDAVIRNLEILAIELAKVALQLGTAEHDESDAG